MLEKTARIIFGLTLFGFLAVVGVQATRLPRVDEMFFHDAAIRWALSGAQEFGLWHTPFYLEALKLWQRVFGIAGPEDLTRVWILRAFGVCTALFTAMLVFFEIRRRREDHALAGALLFSGLLLIQPYFIQSTLLLDIDNTLQMPLLVGWVLLARRQIESPGSWKLGLGLALLFAISMMAKELTPLVLVPVWIVIAASRGLSRGMQAVGIAALGFLLFIGMLVAWTKAYGFSWDAPLRLTFEKSAERTGTQMPWASWGMERFLFLSWLPWIWIGAPLVALVARVTFRLPKTPHEVLQVFPFNVWCALALLAAYTYIVQAAFYFPKYTAAALPLLILALGEKIPLNGMRTANLWVPALLGVVLSVFDPMNLIEYRRDLGVWPLLEHTLAILPLTVAVLWSLRGSPLTAILLLCTNAWGLSMRHALTVESPGYNFGEQGFMQTLTEVRALRAALSPDTPVLTTSVDLAWALQGEGKLVHLAPQHQTSEEVLRSAKILVSRSYDNYAVRFFPEWLLRVEREFPCHAVVAAPRGRFEWWWKPAPGLPTSECGRP
jgi:hypothetical protein